MKKIIPLMMYGLALFGVSAGVGWFLRPQPVPEEELETSDAVNPNVAAIPDVNLPGTSPTTVEGTARPAAAGGSYKPEDRLPTAVRTEPMTVEEIVSMSLSLKSRQAAIAQREDALQRTEAQHQLLMADLQAEQREIEMLVTQAKAQKTATEELLQMVLTTRQQVDTDRATLEQDKKNFELEIEKHKARAEKLNQDLQFEQTKPAAGSPGAEEQSDAERQARLRVQAPMIQAMVPEKAHDIIVEMANDGDLESVGILLSMMDEKKATAILNLIEDPKLTNSILAKVPPKPIATRTAKQR